MNQRPFRARIALCVDDVQRRTTAGLERSRPLHPKPADELEAQSCEGDPELYTR